LLQKKEFVEWRKSSASSVLWLRGIRKPVGISWVSKLTAIYSWAGEDKTRVRSLRFRRDISKSSGYSVIEHLSKENKGDACPAPLAFSYCVRSEGELERANPDEIMRCLLKQLSCSNASLPIREPVGNAYKERQQEAEDHGCDVEKLPVTECEELIIALLENNPATIIIDALDECDPKRRRQLMKALGNIIQKSVKVLVSSRDDDDIICNLEGSPNIFFTVKDNSSDIKRFVKKEVSEAVSDKRLLGGNVSQKKIFRKLIKGAQGM
jgi:hypothetical protein